jgi:recombination protein RecA
MRLDIRKVDTLKDADGAMGNRTKAKVVKNKLAPPFRQAEFDIVFGEGISQEGCIMDMGVQYDIIGKSGSFFSYNGSKIAQGREKLRMYLKENPEIKAEIEQKIRNAAKGSVEEVSADEE